MAHNARIRADLAAWTAHVPVDPAEFEALDQAQFESINGDDGGTWNPAAFIGIGGAGFQFSGTAHRIAGEIASTHGGATPNFTLDGANGIINIDTGGELHVAGNGALQAYMVTLQSGACAQFNGTVGLHAKLDLLGYTDVVWENHSTAAIKSGAQVNVESGGQIDIESGGHINVESGGSIAVASGGGIDLTGSGGASSYMITLGNGAGIQLSGILAAHAKLNLFGYTDVEWKNHATADFDSGSTLTMDAGSYADLGGTNTITGSTSVSGALTLAAGSAPALQDRMTASGAGQVLKRSHQVVLDADFTMNTQQYDHYWVDNSTLSAARTWNLPSVAATTAPPGAVLYVATECVAHQVNIRDAAWGPTYVLKKASGFKSGMVFICRYGAGGARWHPVGSYTEP